MTDIEKRAHDLALSFISYKFSADHDATDPVQEEEFVSMYKKSYDTFIGFLSEGI